jgi:RNA polymerase sigma-70 factor (ECF subfamily)
MAVEATHSSLFRFLKYTLRDEEAARDVFQETFLRVFRGLGTFRWETGLTAWVLTIGRNLALNRIRGETLRGRRTAPLDPEDHALAEPADGPGDREDALASRSLRRAVAALPDAQREAVLLYYLEDLSLGEIAAVTGRPENTLKSDLLRARRSLRRVLGEREPQ